MKDKKLFVILEQGNEANCPMSKQRKEEFSTEYSDCFRLNWTNNKEDSLADFYEKDITWSEGRSLLFDKVKGKYEYYILGIDEILSLVTEVKNIEEIKVPAGKYKCIKVVPRSNNGENIFKENGYMTAWFSNDDRKIPIKIELKTNIGNMVLKLKKIIQ